MKKYAVTSIRKKPDKYIEFLKSEIKRMWGMSRENWGLYVKEHGKPFFEYTKGVTQNVVLSNVDHRLVNLGSEVKISAKVIKKEYNGNGKPVITFELGEVRLMEGK